MVRPDHERMTSSLQPVSPFLQGDLDLETRGELDFQNKTGSTRDKTPKMRHPHLCVTEQGVNEGKIRVFLKSVLFI